ncbi:hypothetical protein HZB89_02090 [archaeon]|nr:hypothetical protein [archaeon]
MPEKKSIVHIDDLTSFVFLGFFVFWIEIMRLEQAIYGKLSWADWLVLVFILELTALFFYYKFLATGVSFRSREEEFRETEKLRKKEFKW